MAEKKVRLTTPVGEARWAHLNTPKAPYDGKGTPKYMIDVVFTPSQQPEWKAWAKDVWDKTQALPKKPTNNAVKPEMDQDKPTGRFYATFKTNEKFKPSIFDKHGNLMPEGTMIGNGSKVRVSYIENVYDGFGGGINFYLNAVQVLELVEYKTQTASAYGFVMEEAPAGDDGDCPF